VHHAANRWYPVWRIFTWGSPAEVHGACLFDEETCGVRN
jgi:hypothetical protein